MPTIEETVNTLKDMGFTEAQAKKALNKTGWTGIEAAAEWLLSNPGDDGTEDASEEPPVSEVYRLHFLITNSFPIFLITFSRYIASF